MSFFPRVIENDVDTTTCRKRIDIDEYTRAAKSASFLLCTTLATRIFIPFTPNLRTFLLCPFFPFIRQRNYPAKRSVAAKRMKEAAARCKLVLFLDDLSLIRSQIFKVLGRVIRGEPKQIFIMSYDT